jgi:glycosyltransferase involved in cell wall biosynthesis
MKIAGFIRLMPAHRGVGGMQGHAQNLYRGLAKRGHTVHVFTTACPGKPHIEEDQGVFVHYLEGTRPAEYSSEYRNLSKQACLELHKQLSFDVIHSESSAAFQLCRGEIPVVATWHGINYCGFQSRLNQDYATNMLHKQPLSYWRDAVTGITKELKELERYDHHVAISHQALDDLVSVYRLPKESISLVFNGFDTTQFQPNKKLGEEIRSTLRIPLSSFVLGVAGRLTVDKGHRFLIKILPDLLVKYPRLRLLIVGGSGIEREYLALQHPSIIYVGPKAYREMPAYYNAMNILLNPTFRYLGLDMTMQEALLCGIPVIATDTGSIKKSLIPDERFGYTHPLMDQSEFNRTFELAYNRTDFDPIAISQHVRAFSSLDAMCKGMEAVFESLIGDSCG